MAQLWTVSAIAPARIAEAGTSPEWAGLAIVLATAVFWLVLAIWALVRRARADRAASRARREAAFERRLAAAAPGGFLQVTPDGRCRLSGRAADWLGRAAEEEASLQDLALPELASLLSEPAQSGAMVAAADGRRLKATRRGFVEDEEGRQRALIWLEDITAELAVQAEKDRAQADAEAAAERLRAIVDEAPFPIWLRDRSLNLVMANAAYVRAVEASSEAAVLEGQLEIVSNSLTGSSRDSALRAREAGSAIAERHFAVVDGQRRALAVTDAPLQDLIAGFAVDMTEAEEARAELARVLDSQSETLNKLSSPVAIFDADQRLRFFNNAFARLSRLSEDWLSEQPDHATLLETMRERRRLPEQADFVAWKREQLALHHSPEPSEEMWHLTDGTALRVVSQPHPLGGLLVLFEDVTDRLALESSYNTLIAVQRETLDNLHEAVAVYGSDGRLKLYNPNYALIWQLDPDFLDGEPHFGEILDRSRHLIHDGSEDWPEERARLLSQVTERTPLAGRWQRGDGHVLDYALVPLPDGRVLTTHVDMTDTVRIEQALRERNEALETADRLKSEFVANMSYELRTPLNSIIGFSELLQSGLAGSLEARQKEYLGDVLSAAAQLRDLIDDILDLAVIEAGVMVLEMEPVAIADIIDSVAAMSLEAARKARVKLESRCEGACGAIDGDRRRLLQACYNLVGNAIKFTPPGGKVTVIARPRGSAEVELVVSDTGIGISEEEQQIVFKKFHTSASLPQRKGVGLGLSLVQSFIELHSGHVDLKSQPGQGTTVTCVLPRTQAPQVLKVAS